MLLVRNDTQIQHQYLDANFQRTRHCRSRSRRRSVAARFIAACSTGYADGRTCRKSAPPMPHVARLRSSASIRPFHTLTITSARRGRFFHVYPPRPQLPRHLHAICGVYPSLPKAVRCWLGSAASAQRAAGPAPPPALTRSADRQTRGCCVQVALLVRVAGAPQARGRSYTRAGFNPCSSESVIFVQPVRRTVPGALSWPGAGWARQAPPFGSAVPRVR